jgi:hypothetical protein
VVVSPLKEEAHPSGTRKIKGLRPTTGNPIKVPRITGKYLEEKNTKYDCIGIGGKNIPAPFGNGVQRFYLSKGRKG